MNITIKNHDQKRRHEIILRYGTIKKTFKVPVGMKMPLVLSKVNIPFQSEVTGEINGKPFSFVVTEENNFVYQNDDLIYDNHKKE